MYPHERSLVKKLAGKPFALLGVNYKDEKATLQNLFKKNEITWRFWCDGTSGRITRQWGVEGFPTLYLIDGQGKIRNHWLGSPSDADLNLAIDKLLAEIK